MSLNEKDLISKYAEQFLKAKMDTDMQMNQGLNTMAGNRKIDGSFNEDYQRCFQTLLDMIDKTLDEYKEELQQVIFPFFTVLYLTMIKRGFDQSAKEFID